jgi:hypothetical protein
MNKEEAAKELECSTRQVEKLAGLGRLGTVEYVRGKRGRQASYQPEEVARLKVELAREQAEVIGEAPAQAGLSTRAAAQGMASLNGTGRADFIDLLAAAIAQASARNHVAPAATVWLTIDGASLWLGLPRRAIERALHADRKAAEEGGTRRIRETGTNAGLRIHAADVRLYFEGAAGA